MKRFIRYLKKRTDTIRKEEREFYENYICSFCGKKEIDCLEGGDHSDEMRWLSRMTD